MLLRAHPYLKKSTGYGWGAVAPQKGYTLKIFYQGCGWGVEGVHPQTGAGEGVEGVHPQTGGGAQSESSRGGGGGLAAIPGS